MRPINCFLKCFALYLILGLTSTALAFESKTDEFHPFGVSFDEGAVVSVADGVARLEFLLTIPKGHYLYAKSIRVALNDASIKTELVMPQGEVKYDEFMGEEVEVLHDVVPVEAKITFDGNVPQTVAGKIYYQGCSGKICFRMFSENFEFKLAHDGTPAVSTPDTHLDGDKNHEFKILLKERDFGKLMEQGIWLAVLVTFLAGVITGFTPCVLPVIPLTLAFIGVTPKEHKLGRVGHLVIFVFGMIMMYATLGVLSAVLGQSLGFAFQSRVFLVVLVVFFAVFGLWSLDIIHWQMPLALQQKIVAIQPKGIVRYFYSGLTIGFLAAPCVGPILGPLLLYIATTKKIMLGFGYMTVYALGLSVMFFVLGFTQHFGTSRFSQFGHIIKKVLGILMLVTSVYYAYALVSPFLDKKSDSLFVTDFQKALQNAKSQNKRVVVDFYADWCLPCHEWDNNVWSEKTVEQTLDADYVAVKIDCTTDTPQCNDMVERYDVVGWPTILFLNNDGSEISKSRLIGIVMSVDEFLNYLKSLP